MYAHPSALDRIGGEPGVVCGGVSALGEHEVDLIVSDKAEVYIRASDVADLIGRFALEPDADRPNLFVRIVRDDAWPFGDDMIVAPWPVVAVDLLDTDDGRSRRAGVELIERLG